MKSSVYKKVGLLKEILKIFRKIYQNSLHLNLFVI